MRTTLINPTVWLLLLTAVMALTGAAHRWTARQTLERVMSVATSRLVLAATIVLAAAGLSSRIALGYLSPGAYAEEVLGARAFLSERNLYAGNGRAEFKAWLAEAPASTAPWTLPGITPCQASAMAERPRFFTSQGHPPTLLLASVPVVRLVGGRGLYVLLVAGSIASLAAALLLLLRNAGLTWRSRTGLLVFAAIAGWQPVMAGLAQGDAVVLAGSLVVLAWQLARRHEFRAGLLAGLSLCLALPAVGAIPALARRRWSGAAIAAAVALSGAAAAMAFGGPLIWPDFMSTLTFSARTYADTVSNYAMVGRLVAGGMSPLLCAGLLLAAAVTTAVGARSSDGAFGAWIVVGLLAAPILWSQHLVLTLVPLTVLLRGIYEKGSSGALAGWAVLSLFVSLPDPAVAYASEPFAPLIPSSHPVPVIPVVLVLLWAWLLRRQDRTVVDA